MVRAVAALLAFAGGATAQPPAMHVHGAGCGSEGCGRAVMMKRRLAEGLPPREGFGERELFAATDVLHNDLDIAVNYDARSIAGSNTMTVRSEVPGLSEFTFMLDTRLAVSRVVFNGSEVLALPVRVGTFGRRVTLPRALSEGEEFTLRIEYGGVPGSGGFGGISFVTMSGVPTVFTLSEPYYSGTWWPAKDGDIGQSGDNSDKATFAIAVTVPASMTVASNGVLQGIDDLGDGRRKHRWRTNYPMSSYLACFSASTYNRFGATYVYPLPGGGEGAMPLEFFVTPGADTPYLRARWVSTRTMLARFRPLFGEYPFIAEKYGIYQFGFGGGMEHQTMSGQSSGTDTWVTAHELAHQWWGDDVTCRTWHDIWLNESFATYAECLFAEHMTGVADRAALESSVSRLGANVSWGSVYLYNPADEGLMFDVGLVYNKGAKVLHTLRTLVDGRSGEGTFFRLLREYRSRYSGSAATTDDFAAVASEVAGRDLTPFFDAWIYGQASPQYEFGYETLTAEGRSYLKLMVRQVQSAPSAAFFPCRPAIRSSNGQTTEDASVELGGRVSWHLVPRGSAGEVSSVTFDPSNVLLKRGAARVSYVAGPPKVISAVPAPGARLADAPGTIRIGFSDPISASAGQFEVRRGETAVACSLSLDAGVATLTPAGRLVPGVYTVTVRDTVTANGGQRLDGEIDRGVLPSGDGVATGPAVFTFTVEACRTDFNLDGFVDFFDYDDFVACFEAGECGAGTADFNGDGFLDFFDYDEFVGAFETGC
jgi:hypothetical protein